MIPRRPNRARELIAMTLIELLAVVSILGLSTTALLGVIGPMSAGQRRAQAVATTVDAIERARLAAEHAREPVGYGAPAVTLTLGETLVASYSTWGSPQRESIFAQPLPRGWSAALHASDRAGDNATVRWWPGGWSDDATISLTSTTGASASIALLGLSGQVRELPIGVEDVR